MFIVCINRDFVFSRVKSNLEAKGVHMFIINIKLRWTDEQTLIWRSFIEISTISLNRNYLLTKYSVKVWFKITILKINLNHDSITKQVKDDVNEEYRTKAERFKCGPMFFLFRYANFLTFSNLKCNLQYKLPLRNAWVS